MTRSVPLISLMRWTRPSTTTKS
ncbi:MAG: hypothetical protein JWP95_1245, partial [Actinotalea sp.]|nr:hypothetical protein [Actinotalea sp.]